MSDLDISGLYEVPSLVQTTYLTLRPSFRHVSTIKFGGFLSQHVSFVSLWGLVVVLLVLGNMKSLPMIWHVSISDHLLH